MKFSIFDETKKCRQNEQKLSYNLLRLEENLIPQNPQKSQKLEKAEETIFLHFCMTIKTTEKKLFSSIDGELK